VQIYSGNRWSSRPPELIVSARPNCWCPISRLIRPINSGTTASFIPGIPFPRLPMFLPPAPLSFTVFSPGHHALFMPIEVLPRCGGVNISLSSFLLQHVPSTIFWEGFPVSPLQDSFIPPVYFSSTSTPTCPFHSTSATSVLICFLYFSSSNTFPYLTCCSSAT